MNEEKLDMSDNSSDRELIISLLNEYANKLRERCDRLIKIRQQEVLFLYIFVISFSLLYFVATFLVKINDLLALIGILTLSLITFLVPFKQRIQNLQALKRDTRIIAMKLERAIRATSQAEEYVESNFARRIELDFRLAEAEEAIEYYQTIFNDNLQKKVE